MIQRAPKGLKRHPIGALWPNLPPEEFRQLRDDIARNGVKVPIIIQAGKILDGWQRYRAATAANRDCPMVEMKGDPSQLVLSMNSSRRHVTKAQRIAYITLTMEAGSGRVVSNQAIATFCHVSAGYVSRVRKWMREGWTGELMAGNVGVTELDEQRAKEEGRPATAKQKARERRKKQKAEVDRLFDDRAALLRAMRQCTCEANREFIEQLQGE